MGLTFLCVASAVEAAPTRSTDIALTNNGSRLVNVNHEADSVTFFDVRGGGRRLTKVAEIAVGNEPHCVAVDPRGGDIFVTNGADGTVSVIAPGSRRVVRVIPVGTEPRGCALTPNGKRLFVANHTAGTVSIINTSNRRVIDTVNVGGNPFAIAVTDGPGNNERVFVTDFYARLRPGPAGREGFDDGKQGIVRSFRVDAPNNIVTTTLAPLADSGFTANRAAFCNGTANPDPVNQTFCPDLTAVSPADPDVAQDPQGVFPNQFFSAVIRGNRLYLPNIGAQPEPPVQFTVNVQALVNVVSTQSIQEVGAAVNLNDQIDTEPVPANPTQSLARLFGNDIVAIDASPSGNTFFIVSRGGNYVLRVRRVNGQLSIGAPNSVVRFQTGNIPTGIALNGRFAYVNNEVGHSVSILDLGAGVTVRRDVASSEPPKPGSHEHAVLLGKLVFFTALGVPDNGLVGQQIRNIVPLDFRGKQSNNAWSSCGSCHPAGLSDGVTWIFGDGPRNTIPLDGLYSKVNGPHDIRINNYSAARDSVTDFNNNSRGVQGGVGFASDPPFSAAAPNPAVFDHGFSQGASEALDFETQWAETVRPFNVPQDPAAAVGADVFRINCASCHGGAKWTKSQVIYANNPSLDRAFAAGGVVRDSGLTIIANQAVSYFAPVLDPSALQFIENIGTFSAVHPIEIRGAGATIGQAPLGGNPGGFNVPSLLSVSFHAPYFHNGAAQTLTDVFNLHGFGGGTIATTLSQADRDNLLGFLNSLDARTPFQKSDADIFRDPNQDL
ncbi:MAG: beta-propeller fold lactonase family protein [Gammaproteobacteria bacterium]